MTLLSTSSEGREMPKSVLASADATLTLSKEASLVHVLRSVDGQAAELVAGVFFSQDGFVVYSFSNPMFEQVDIRWLWGEGWTPGYRAGCQ